jgi:hypothetical protein
VLVLEWDVVDSNILVGVEVEDIRHDIAVVAEDSEAVDILVEETEYTLVVDIQGVEAVDILDSVRFLKCEYLHHEIVAELALE